MGNRIECSSRHATGLTPRLCEVDQKPEWSNIPSTLNLNQRRTLFMSFSLKSLCAAALISAAPFSAAFAADTFALDPAHTQTIFTIDHLGFSTITGAVHDIKGTLLLDTAKPENSVVTVTMAADSVDTGFAARDKSLQGPVFFNVAQFPTMTFKSTHIKMTGDKTADIQGDFTLLGITKPLILKTTFNRMAQDTTGTNVFKAGFTATTIIRRSDFGMKAYVPYVGDDVHVTINFEGIKQ
ncbi:YceI family protein [Paraburkholderia bryophila]|uniref:Polyisoprenoid-binding protein YceI n=1 Tax=Paraburkholderia bryophila TaxID=420952 RepID=A0A7Y9W2M2_9BURK|nr:YceI family protein [Paraburkholderia bryophila]NYH13151.1 polyisoprenoid-binding protein YceI [Paraburkholderia bryophila]